MVTAEERRGAFLPVWFCDVLSDDFLRAAFIQKCVNLSSDFAKADMKE